MIRESDAVAIERIKSETYRELELAKYREKMEREQKAKKEASARKAAEAEAARAAARAEAEELAAQRHQEMVEAEKAAEARKRAYNGKYGKLAIFCAVMGFANILGMASQPARLIEGLVFLGAWLLGRRNGYGKTRASHKVLAIFGLLLLVSVA